MTELATQTTIKIPEKALKRGVVILDLLEYRKLQEQAIPTYYLSGKVAEKLDKEVEEALREHREGKTQRIKSLADLR
jgi:hypothetical protein